MPDSATEPPSNEGQTEKVVVYMSPTLLRELDSRAEGAPDESCSRSRVVRDALRAHFRRRPRGGS